MYRRRVPPNVIIGIYNLNFKVKNLTSLSAVLNILLSSLFYKTRIARALEIKKKTQIIKNITIIKL